MKRIAFVVAITTLFVFLLSSNLASRAGASKDKGRSDEREVSRREGKPRAEGRKPRIATLSRRNQITSLYGLDTTEPPDERADDPDRPPG